MEMATWTMMCFIIAFIWLLKETNFLRVRLPVGKLHSHKVLLLQAAKVTPILALPQGKIIDKLLPYYWMYDKSNLIVCRHQYHCPYQSKCHKTGRQVSWQIPARTIKAFNSEIKFNSGCGLRRAFMLKEMANEFKNKPRQIPLRFSDKIFVQTIRIGSHKETTIRTGGYNNRKHTQSQIVEDFKTVYHDSLVSKEWLEAHIQDEYPEPTIDITVDDGKEIHVNGNYKRGMIGEFIDQYKAPKIKKVKVK
jgi:hypothetical protein